MNFPTSQEVAALLEASACRDLEIYDLDQLIAQARADLKADTSLAPEERGIVEGFFNYATDLIRRVGPSIFKAGYSFGAIEALNISDDIRKELLRNLMQIISPNRKEG